MIRQSLRDRFRQPPAAILQDFLVVFRVAFLAGFLADFLEEVLVEYLAECPAAIILEDFRVVTQEVHPDLIPVADIQEETPGATMAALLEEILQEGVIAEAFQAVILVQALLAPIQALSQVCRINKVL